jgi:hypothetical protein
VSRDAPARQDVPFDADRCHQMSVSRMAETISLTPETRHNASNCRMHRHAVDGAPALVSFRCYVRRYSGVATEGGSVGVDMRLGLFITFHANDAAQRIRAKPIPIKAKSVHTPC